MGVKHKYYYLKPKSSGDTAVLERPKRVTTLDFKRLSVVATQVSSPVLDMDFVPQTQTATTGAISFVKGGLILMVAAAMYLGGIMIYSGAAGLRERVTDLSVRGMDKLSLAGEAIAGQDMLGAKSNFIAAENLFATAQQEVLALGQTNLYLSGLALDRSKIVAGQQLIDSGVSLAQAGQILLDATGPMFQYLNGTQTSALNLDAFTTQFTALLTAGRPDLDRAIAKVNRASQLLGSVNPAVVGEEYAAALLSAQAKTDQLQELVGMLGILAQELPDALGFKNPRHYLILNQNNNELRPTGGFVGSFVNLEVYQGKIRDLKVDITQRIDGQLGHVGDDTMPAPLRVITTQFGTRDSNWYLNFPQSAQSFQKLYEQAGGGTADGIFAINPTIIEDLLTIFGPIHLVSKDIEITAQNFVERTQQQIEIIDNDKENPKEILVEIAPILIGRLLQANQVQLQLIYSQILKRIASKDVLMYFRSPKLQSVAAGVNAAGVVADQTAGDFLSVVQTNLGGTKSSQNLVQEINHSVSMSLVGEIIDTVKLTYTHTGSYEFPDGVNKNYLRVYVPLGSTIRDYSGQDDGTEIEIYTESGKTVFAMWVTTEPQESSEVQLTYQLPPSAMLQNYYQLYIQKQPGANNTRLTSTLRLSPALQLTDGGNTVRFFQDKFTGDLSFGVDVIPID